MYFYRGETAFILELTCISSTKFCWIIRIRKLNQIQENTFTIDVSSEISN